MENNTEHIEVCAFLPFWRYAVGPTSERTPAIPFYRVGPAVLFFYEAMVKLPFSGVRLYRRRWWGALELLDEYIPKGRAEDF